MRNIDVRIHVKLELQEIGCLFNIKEQLRYYCEGANPGFLDPSPKNWPTQKFRPLEKKLTHEKIYLTNATHVKIMTCVKCWPT